jgi:hypothetical protein
LQLLLLFLLVIPEGDLLLPFLPHKRTGAPSIAASSRWVGCNPLPRQLSLLLLPLPLPLPVIAKQEPHIRLSKGKRSDPITPNLPTIHHNETTPTTLKTTTKPPFLTKNPKKSPLHHPKKIR